ncbi:hypothetical protein [Streptomyces sp. NPDC001020]
MKIQERTGAGAGRSAAPAQQTAGDRLPAPPRERKPALAALAVLLILVGALGATMLVLQAGDRIEVVKVTSDIQPGESVDNSKVTSVMVAADEGIHYVKWSQLGALKSLKARSTIYAGTVVVGEMFAGKSSLPEGKAVVGLSLKEGQYPASIKEGDIVAAYLVGSSGSSSSSSRNDASAGSVSGTPIVANARVTKASENNGDALSSGNKQITVTVDKNDAPALAKAAAAGDVAVVLVSGN